MTRPLPAVLGLSALLLLALAGCSSDTAAPPPEAAPADAPDAAVDTAAALALTPAQKSERAAMADESAAAFRTADGQRRLSEACAEAGSAAMLYRDAGRPAEADRWQARSDSACAAIEPEIERTLARITDSLAAARGD